MELTQQDKQKLIKYLNLVSIIEAQKPSNEMDEEFLDACTVALLKLQDKHVELSPEYIDEKVRKIFHPEDTEATEPETVKAPKKVVSKKKIWLVAACIAVLVALFSIVSFSCERSVVDVLEDFFGTYEFIPFGKEVDVGEETYVKETNTREYNSVQEAVISEKINILIPKNKTIKLVSVGEYHNKTDVYLAFYDTMLSINITLNSSLEEKTKEICDEILRFNDNNYYLCTINDRNQVQVYFMYDDNLYTVTCSDRNLLIDILQNMEEVKYED